MKSRLENEFDMLSELEQMLNHGSMPQHIVEGRITKGMFGSQNKYKFVINSNDHIPPHFHVSVNDQQIAKYSLETGLPLASTNPQLDKIVTNWLSRDDHLEDGLSEWRRFHGENHE